MEIIAKKLQNIELQMAPDKTGAIILRGLRGQPDVHFRLMNRRITPVKELKYLKVMLDHKLMLGAHVMHIVNKAKPTLAALLRIMPNIGEPGGRRRDITALGIQNHKKALEGLQGRALFNH